MALPTQLNAAEQDTLVKQIGLALLRAAPRDWQRITAEYRAVGKYHELTGELFASDGSVREWVATHDIATLFGKLRAGMYREGRGTWFNARYQLDHPSSYNLEYDREEPAWDLQPPPQAYADELRMYPRSEDNVPDWLMRRLAGLGPERPGPHFRIARIFDGAGPSGPVINRPEVAPNDHDRLLDYLDEAPLVTPSRGYDIDRLADSPEASVPVAFHSDGVWVWPAAVNYYLREYGISPEPDLVQHIRANGFVVGEVSESTRQAAGQYVNRGSRQQQGGQQQAKSGGERQPDPPVVDEQSSRMNAPIDDPDPVRQQNGIAQHPGVNPSTMFAASPAADPTPQTELAPAITSNDQIDEQPSRQRSEPELDQLQAKFDELGIPDTVYRIGKPTEYGWSLEQVDAGWRVGWYADELTSPAIFGDLQDAAAFMLGKVLLQQEGQRDPVGTRHGGGAAAGERPAREAGIRADSISATSVPATSTAAPSRTTMVSSDVVDQSSASPAAAEASPMRSPTRQAQQKPSFNEGHDAAAQANAAAPGQHVQPAAQRRGGQSAAETSSAGRQQWPIQPLQGEPPLTLFRGKEMCELPTGSELDRFGGPTGNLTYAAGTPFEERSLVPEWVNRPYHVYRVQRPLEALSGIAIPWFNQPGGGAAYVLPTAIDELVADGYLLELAPGEPPID